MGAPLPQRTQRVVFAVAVPAALTVVGIAAALLDPSVPQATRQSSSGILLLLAGVAGGACSYYRARQTSGRRRRSWLLFVAASGLAIASNLYGVLLGTDTSIEPSSVSDFGIVGALLLVIIGLIGFPGVRHSGSSQVMAVLDGLVAGGGVLTIVAVLIYPNLLESGTAGAAAFAASLLIPVLDVVLITVALTLLIRAHGPDRPTLVLIASGFLMYGSADLAYAVLVSEGSFDFGTRLDLGWIAGYLVVSLAALLPSREAAPVDSHPSNTRGSVLVFGVLLVAGVVQVRFGEQLRGSNLAIVWLLLVLLAGVRQAILSVVNDSLRRGLQRRVDEQTADLARLAAQNELLLTSVGDGIYGVDRSGRISFVNPSAAEALGFRTDELLGREAHGLFHSDHDVEECYVHLAVHAATAGSDIEDEYRRVGERAFPVEVTASPLVHREGEDPVGAVVVFRDVTQRREVERMKNEFLSVVSHELRTPLTSIRGSLGLLAGGAVGELDPRAAAMVSVASESSERLTRLINDLLDMERITAGGRALRLTAVDAGDLVRSAVAQMEGAAVPRDVVVSAGPSEGRVLCDEDQVLQTLANLLGNAIKFSEAGGEVVVSAAVEGEHVLFRVRDQGRGIPGDKLGLIFEPFAQVDSSDAREKGGTGLGLAICRAIVDHHGGRIWAESRPGQGTTMLFTLPAATGDRVPEVLA
ncbi:ATP-binding protein [Nocardioides coralli]|uniref:ATP-binding protein n=1 Tax=Nocardioides coralli TaxID=2872154 RepID=UPI001CA3D95B|nr:ATP-binding protein [Nocardioides coralli]QZY30080.1 PAS domain-containing protein [Nocardioides coralli]